MKDNKISKILNIFVAIIVAIALFLFVRVFMEDAEVMKTDPEVQKVVDPLIWFSKILLYVAVGVTLVLSLWSLLKKPAALKKALLGVLALVVVLAIAYFMSSDAEVMGTEKVLAAAGSSTSKWVGTMITYSMILGAIGTLFFVGDLLKGLIKS